jgi:hypothetical protein
MSLIRPRRILLLLGITLIVVGLISVSLNRVHAQAGTGGSNITRPHDPVVLTGSDFPAFLGENVADLALYAFNGSIWTPIPFQVDEVDASGFYTTTDDGLLDANDELVFMGYDAGEPSSCTESLTLNSGVAHSRTAVTVTDPLNSDSGTVYLYRNLSGTAASYVSWNQVAQSGSGSFNSMYSVAFGGSAPQPYIGIDSLTVNSTSDILDRLKLRLLIQARVFFGFCIPGYVDVDLDEQSAADLLTPTIDLSLVGPIRAVAPGEALLNVAAYGSRIDIGVYLDPAALEDQVDLPIGAICAGTLRARYARISLDGSDPGATGINQYFDSATPAGATIDGTPDAGLPAATPISWFQVGDDGTNGGLVVAIRRLDAGAGILGNYYVDDNSGGVTGDPAPYDIFADTGDNLSYGDAGILVSESFRDPLDFALTAYALESGTTGNVGDTYYNYATIDLMGATADESCSPPPLAVDVAQNVTTSTSLHVLVFGLVLLLAGTFSLIALRSRRM